MLKIYKYTILSIDDQVINMPKDAQILSVQVQNGAPCIWALVNPSGVPEDRHFRIKGTGWDISDIEKLTYIATFQDPPFVWHLFEEVM